MKQALKNLLKLIAKSLAIFFTVSTLALVIISLVRPEWIKDGIKWIGALIETLGNWNYLIAFASACIESLPIIGTAVPGMNVMILVGGFWGVDHMIPTIVLASLGAMIGNYLGYWIGKWYGVDLIERYGDWFGLGRTEAGILRRQIERNGFWYIVLGKFHNFTRAFIPFIAGSSGMSERSFWMYNMIGSLIWAVSINLLGIYFIASYEVILDHLGKIMLALLVVVFGYFYIYRRDALRDYMKAKEQEIREKEIKKRQQKSL